MKIGVVGCGLNSDYHIGFARAYIGSEIVGLVDKDKERASQCAAKHGIRNVYGSIEELVLTQKPDVIHVVTPPGSHYSLVKEAIRLKCNVLVEKPMTLSYQDAQELYTLADSQEVKLCTMHNHLFDPCMMKARALIDAGAIGKIINVESYYGLNTRIDAFRKYPAPNVLPWIYTLPGGVFHDFIPHPLYVMLPFTGQPDRIHVMEKSCGELPQNISDELRILIDGENCLGTSTFSFAAKPHLHFVNIYGSKMMIHVDFNTMTTTCHPVSSLPKAAQKATYNLSESWQLFTNTVANVLNFARGRLKPYQGMKTLIHQYYDSLKGKQEVPVSKDESLMVIGAIDEICKQINNIHLDFDPVIQQEKQQETGNGSKILVTGGTGFLGKRLVQMLVNRGYSVRALARKLSSVEELKKLGAEIFFGDVADLDSLRPAFEGVDYVIHAAADTTGDQDQGELSTIQGTRNVIDLSENVKIKKLVYISSCSVYGVADYKTGHVITEGSAVERFSIRRGAYSHAKLQAETIVRQAMNKSRLPIVCLRPGTIFGPGGEVFTPMMGFSLGRKAFAIIGDGDFILPFVYIDNLVEAIMSAMSEEVSTGKIYNVVDFETPTKRNYVDSLLKRLYPKAYFFYIPYRLLYAIVFMQEMTFNLLRRNPFLTRYRLTSSQKNIVYDSSAIKNELRWTPSVSFKDAVQRILDFETGGIVNKP